MSLVKSETGLYYNHHCDGEPVDSTREITGESCPKKVKSTSLSIMHAQRLGWFFSKDGKTAYCPDCIPPEIKEWRKKKKRERENKRGE